MKGVKWRPREARTDMAKKIGCVVYVRLPAMLRRGDEDARRGPHDESGDADPLDEVLVLYMN